MTEREKKEFADLYYDVWRSGGNPDMVNEDRFEDQYEGRYDFIYDAATLNAELNRQIGEKRRK